MSAHLTLYTLRFSFQTSVCAQCWALAQSLPPNSYLSPRLPSPHFLLHRESSPKALPSLCLSSMKIVSHPLLFCLLAAIPYEGHHHLCLFSHMVLCLSLMRPDPLLHANCTLQFPRCKAQDRHATPAQAGRQAGSSPRVPSGPLILMQPPQSTCCLCLPGNPP